MHSRATFTRLVSTLVASAVLSLGGVAFAEPEYEVAVAGGTVEVKAKGGWHINKDYPWKLVMGETKLDKSKFTLTDEVAKIAPPKGTYKMKGGVCSEGQCVMIEKTITVP